MAQKSEEAKGCSHGNLHAGLQQPSWIMPQANCARVSSKEKSASPQLEKTKKKKVKQKLVLKVFKHGVEFPQIFMISDDISIGDKGLSV